jgi:ribosomal protein L23
VIKTKNLEKNNQDTENFLKKDFLKTYKPINTHKSNVLINNKYTFFTNLNYSKPFIKRTLKTIFKIDTISINTSILPQSKKSVRKFMNLKLKQKKVIITLMPNIKNLNL